MTERLYDQDAYLKVFSAGVLSCREGSRGWEVVLDRTAFYPEGGGQPGDTGTLDTVEVLDTQETADAVVHLCGGPLEPGALVQGRIDWERRFDLMQQHSAEHIVSGIVCSRFQCHNVGFHLGSETTVMDFDHPMEAAELAEVERAANEVVWENRPFRAWYPDREELETLPYRSKKALTGPVRLVECPGADLCACCGTHVHGAGELGLIRLPPAQMKPFRNGVRLELLAGRRAYEAAVCAAEQNRRVSVLTSAKQTETAAAVERLLSELAETKYRLAGMENRVFQMVAEETRGLGDTLLFLEQASPDGLRRCCEAVAACCGGRCAVFSPAEGGGYRYALSADGEAAARALGREMFAALDGRGGGKNGFLQGAVAASQDKIRAFFQKNGWREST